MGTLKEARITSEQCLNSDMLHDFLKESLGFPDYYGRNFAALADCLAEMGEPALITIAVDEDTLPTEMQAYILKTAQVCAREAVANENLNLIIEHR